MIVGLGWYIVSFLLGLSSGVWPDLLPVILIVVTMALASERKRAMILTVTFALTFVLTSIFLGLIVGLAAATLTEWGIMLALVRPLIYLVVGLVTYWLALGELGLLPRPLPPQLLSLAQFNRAATWWSAAGLGLMLALPGIISFEPTLLLPLTAALTASRLTLGALTMLFYSLGRLLPLFILVAAAWWGKNLLAQLANYRERWQKTAGWFLVFLSGLIVVSSLVASTNLSLPVGAISLIALWLWPWWHSVWQKRQPVGTVLFCSLTLFLFALYVLPQETNWWGWLESFSPSMTYQESAAVRRGSVVNFSYAPDPILVGIPTVLIFSPADGATAAPLPASDLAAGPSGQMQAVAIRDDLSEFSHFVPTPDDRGLFTSQFVFPSPGRYKIWSEIKTGQTSKIFGFQPVEVIGGGVVSEPGSDEAGPQTVGPWQVNLASPAKLVSGAPLPLTIDLTSASAQPNPTIDIYVVAADSGYLAHQTINPSDGLAWWRGLTAAAFDLPLPAVVDQTGTANKFFITLPRPGDYRVFVDLLTSSGQPSKNKAAAFWLKVEPPDPVGSLTGSQMILALVIILAAVSLFSRLIQINQR